MTEAKTEQKRSNWGGARKGAGRPRSASLTIQDWADVLTLTKMQIQQLEQGKKNPERLERLAHLKGLLGRVEAAAMQEARRQQKRKATAAPPPQP